MTRRERVLGGLYGLLVGDALGVPYEFHPAREIPPEVEMRPPPGFVRAHAGVPPGTWSDDGAQALCLLASLLERGKLDVDDFAGRLVDWHGRGRYAVDGVVFDVGIQTATALQRLRQGVPATEAGPASERSNGNGSLMRVMPLALWHRGDDAALVADAHIQSRVTHGHARSLTCCALYCLWARRLLDEHPSAWTDAVATLRALYRGRAELEEALEFHIRPDDDAPGRGGGYVVDCLRSARAVCRLPTYEAVVKAAVALGDDTDTTACVAGGIAGVRDGVGAIPARWLDALRGREIVEPLAAALLDSLKPEA